MKIKKGKIGKATTTRIEFEDGTVWEEVDMPPEWYQGSDVDAGEAKAIVLDMSTAKLKRFEDDE